MGNKTSDKLMDFDIALILIVALWKYFDNDRYLRMTWKQISNGMKEKLSISCEVYLDLGHFGCNPYQ
jgi:hypothetical protein